MKFNGFIVAIVVLAALGAALYWSNHHMPSETTQASAETPPKILTLNEADINKIDIKKKGGEEVTRREGKQLQPVWFERAHAPNRRH